MSRAARLGCLAAALTSLLAGAAVVAAPSTVPPWVLPAIAAADTAAADADAIVLLDAREVTVEPDGRVTTHVRYAVRIRASRAARAARCEAAYVTGESQVRSMHAWLLPPHAEAVALGPQETADQDAEPGSVYQESRLRVIDVSARAFAGCVFAGEWTVEDRVPFLQLDFEIQRGLPVVLSTLRLEVPRGWRVEPHLFNHAAVEPVPLEDGLAWEFRDLAPVPLEPWSPPPASLAARLAVSLTPPAALRAQTFDDWRGVSRWIAGLASGQDVPDAALLARARELSAIPGEMPTVRAAAWFVQDIRYVSIQMGIGRGGGYRPRQASEVLQRGYGDCKDKANLLCALVRAMGGRAWLVPVYSGDPDYVHEEWASPQQFNHCIAAISVSDSCRAPAIAQHPVLGRLLYVDPTDPDTPCGELPAGEQGALAVIAADEAGGSFGCPPRLLRRRAPSWPWMRCSGATARWPWTFSWFLAGTPHAGFARCVEEGASERFARWPAGGCSNGSRA